MPGRTAECMITAEVCASLLSHHVPVAKAVTGYSEEDVDNESFGRRKKFESISHEVTLLSESLILVRRAEFAGCGILSIYACRVVRLNS